MTTVRLVGPSQRAYATKDCAHCAEPFERDVRNTWAYWERAKYCCQRCSALAQTARAEASREPIEVAFNKWIDKSADCWTWTGALDRDGYGIFSYARKTFRAARVALELDGRPPGKLFACHTCDNPRCVRFSHLFAGSNKENMIDMVQKGRNPHRFGEKNPNWKGGKYQRAPS